MHRAVHALFGCLGCCHGRRGLQSCSMILFNDPFTSRASSLAVRSLHTCITRAFKLYSFTPTLQDCYHCTCVHHAPAGAVTDSTKVEAALLDMSCSSLLSLRGLHVWPLSSRPHRDRTIPGYLARRPIGVSVIYITPAG